MVACKVDVRAGTKVRAYAAVSDHSARKTEMVAVHASDLVTVCEQHGRSDAGYVLDAEKPYAELDVVGRREPDQAYERSWTQCFGMIADEEVSEVQGQRRWVRLGSLGSEG